MAMVKKYDGTSFSNIYSISKLDVTSLVYGEIKIHDFTSLYFDGDGDYLSIPYTTDLKLNTSNFTIEYQVKPSSTMNVNGGHIFGDGDSAANNGSIMSGVSTTGTVQFASYHSSTAATVAQTNTGLLDFNKFNHVAICGVHSGILTVYIYINGIHQRTGTFDTQSIGGNNPFIIGRQGSYTGADRYFKGYLSNIRISKGISRYSSNFTPSREIPTIDSYTKLLITGESPISDKCGKSVTVYGNTTSTKTYSSVSTDISNVLYFDGNSDYISIPNSDDFNFGTANFTVEYQIKYNNAAHAVLSKRAICGYCNFQEIRSNAFVVCDGSNIKAVSAVGSNNDSQHHVAFVRNNGYLYAYTDGIVQQSVDCSYNLVNSTNVLIGNNPCVGVDGTPYFYGRLSNLRISKGIARYTTNFIPARTRYPLDQYTKLFITGESPIADKTGKTVTVYGNTISTKVTI